MSSKQYFENIAEDWDKMRESFFPRSIRNKAILLAGINKGSLVADIGAGSGFISEGLIDKQVRIVAVDQSQKMLEVMKQKFKDYANFECRLGESENLPFQENELDFVFANMYLHHVDNPQKSINELIRILKAGGKLIITDLDKHSHEFLVKEQHDKWMGFDRSDIQNWFKDSGFKNIQIDCIGDDCCADSETYNESAQISVFIAIGQK
ncbi:MAG: methyltransferase domain-containing protein [Bacteroidales bacterium]|nr:methyltransferase domain-containing protein [Bacteroidales bacterium]